MVKRYNPEWGYTASGCIEKPPPGDVQDDTKFVVLQEMLQVKLSFEDRESLHEATLKFLMYKGISNPPSLNKGKAACKVIDKDLGAAIKILKKIDKNGAQTKDRLCSVSQRAGFYLTNIEVLIDGLESISQAARLIIRKRQINRTGGTS